MSAKYPIIAITGSSGSGTSSVMKTFDKIFRREGVQAVMIEGDSFHRYDRQTMLEKQREAEAAGNQNFSHFGLETNLLSELEELFKSFSETGQGQHRRYLHNSKEAQVYRQPAGTFTPWEPIPEGTELLFYEGLHGAVSNAQFNIAQYPDLMIGVTPVTNLEWTQKILRDSSARGYSPETVTDTILRRMPDYVNHICPQFSNTHVNFQRVPMVDTSNPFAARDIPLADESMLVIRFAQTREVDFPYLLNMISGSFMSRANTLVVPGGKMQLAMQLIFTPYIWRLMKKRKKALEC